MLPATLRNKATDLLTILVRTEHVHDLLRPLRRAAPLDKKYAPMACSHNVTMTATVGTFWRVVVPRKPDHQSQQFQQVGGLD